MVKLNCDKLKFDEKSHTYKVGKKKLQSVTEWIGGFFGEFDEDKISKKVALKRLKEMGVTPETVESDYNSILEQIIKEVLEEWQASRDDGTLIHKEIEDWINTRAEPQESKSRNGVNWLLLNASFGKHKYSEVKIYSEELGLAGTIDLLIIKEDKITKPRVKLVDWKSNKDIKTSNRWQLTKEDSPVSHLHDCSLNKYALQLSVYAYMLEKEYDFIVEGLTIVHLLDDRYVEIPVDYMKETVKKMLSSEQDKRMLEVSK